MVELIPWKDEQMKKLRKDMDHLFNRVWSGFGISRFPSEIVGMPSIDLSETKDTITVTADLPGIRPEDLDITLTEDRLTIRGRKTEESVDEGDTHHRVERTFGSFSRSLRLPCKIRKEDVRATYQSGTLRIEMPKCEPDKPRTVQVEVK
jgi:HSP20 family protein